MYIFEIAANYFLSAVLPVLDDLFHTFWLDRCSQIGSELVLRVQMVMSVHFCELHVGVPESSNTII